MTHHAGVDGRGVRPDLVLHSVVVLRLVRRQDAVDLAANEPRLHRNLAAVTLRKCRSQMGTYCVD